MSPSTSIDPLAATTTALQQALAEGVLTSTQLVASYLAQIDQYEPFLNAFIALAPCTALAEAAARLDRERAQGQLRGPLHGIPIVLKVGEVRPPLPRRGSRGKLRVSDPSQDIFTTTPSLGMGTTAGACAFAGAVAKGNSALAQKLLDAGLIIMGKTNMTASPAEKDPEKNAWIDRWAGVLRYEDDHPDARMVSLGRPDYVTIRGSY